MITRPLGTLQCNHGGDLPCANRGPGHDVQPIQARLAAATASRWVDGIVSAVSADGWIGVVLVGRPDAAAAADAESVWLWNHADLTAHLDVGAPVSIHSVYNVLAGGRSRISVVRI
jgi:hypothetical protein